MNEVAIIESDIAALDALDPQSREVALTAILTQSRDWLVRATQATDPARAVSDFKAFISTVAEAAKQKKVSEDIVTEATVMVRRTERALGVAIREGQERGTVTNPSTAAIQRELIKSTGVYETPVVPGPTEFAPPHELFGAKPGMGIYAMTDDVTDAQFEEALTEAVQEGNVSRANVVRKIRGDDPAVKRPRNGPVMSRAINSLAGLCSGLETITTLETDIDTAEAHQWMASLNKSIAELNRIRNLVKDATK